MRNSRGQSKGSQNNRSRKRKNEKKKQERRKRKKIISPGSNGQKKEK